MFLSAGHSTSDPGAVGFGRKEADIAVDFRNILSSCLADLRVAHTVDGRGLANTPLKDAIIEARKHSIAMEFHCNAGPPTATGVEVLCGADDNVIAARICAAISSSLGIRNRGVKPEGAGQHKRLGFVQAGGMIVELFFISNKDDLAKYDVLKWKCARAVAEVLRAA